MIDNDPQMVITAIGEELVAVRKLVKGRGRRKAAELLSAHLGKKVPMNTLACWEQGARAIPMERFISVCLAYGVDPSQVLADAIRRTTLDPRCPTCGTRPSSPEPLGEEEKEEKEEPWDSPVFA